MTDPQSVVADTTRPANGPTGFGRPPRIASPVEPADVRPENDLDFWVAVAAELAE
jgi:hypothetical protein